MGDHSRSDWESVPADPDPQCDLGYLSANWETIRTTSRRQSHLLFLPRETHLLEREAYIIASESAVVETAAYR